MRRVAAEIDRDTGKVSLKKYVAVDDCGTQVNPLLVEGQVQGGIAYSIGQALFEETRQNIRLFYLHEQVNMWVASAQLVDGLLITDHAAH